MKCLLYQKTLFPCSHINFNCTATVRPSKYHTQTHIARSVEAKRNSIAIFRPLHNVWVAGRTHARRLKCWRPPDNSCAECCYIRADKQHLFPIIQDETRNWVREQDKDEMSGGLTWAMMMMMTIMFWKKGRKDHKPKGHLKHSAPNKKWEQFALTWQ